MGNSVESVDIKKELSLGHVKFDQFKRQQSGSGNADGENFSQQVWLCFVCVCVCVWVWVCVCFCLCVCVLGFGMEWKRERA